MMRSLRVWCALMAALLTPKQALDLHCKLTCLDEGEYGGEWSEAEKACLCQYVRIPALKIDGVFLKKEEKEEKEPYRPYR